LSPEPRLITGLTPRVLSRVASHNSPGIIFSVPPRRPPRTCPRFRHQTNSFSFDESERSSVAYEHDFATPGSTNESTPKPDDDLSFCEELQDNLLPSSVAASIGIGHMVESEESVCANVPSHTPLRRHRDFIFSSPRLSESGDEDNEGNGIDTKSSPNLPLPPPFSSASRNVSNSRALPGSYPTSNLAKSPISNSSFSPTRDLEEGVAIRASSQLSNSEGPRRTAVPESSPVCNPYTSDQQKMLIFLSLVG
jgi:hypothetical protein